MPLVAYFPVILTEVTPIVTQLRQKSFITLAPGANPIKLFTAVIYGFL